MLKTAKLVTLVTFEHVIVTTYKGQSVIYIFKVSIALSLKKLIVLREVYKSTFSKKFEGFLIHIYMQ